MNALGIAIERAVQESIDRAGLETRFEEEWERLQNHPEAGSHVLAVPRKPALAWAMGKINQFDLLLSVNGSSEAMFWASLPRLSAFYPGLEQCRTLYESGARLLVLATDNPAVLKHCLKWGCEPCFVQGEYTRLLAHGDALRNWIGRFCK